jgi:predicted XRE-type DNA-binding protein
MNYSGGKPMLDFTEIEEVRNLHSAMADQIGERNLAAKLDNEKVKDIKYLLENTCMRQYQIAEIFGVHKDTISKINTGRNWSHIL